MIFELDQRYIFDSEIRLHINNHGLSNCANHGHYNIAYIDFGSFVDFFEVYLTYQRTICQIDFPTCYIF